MSEETVGQLSKQLFDEFLDLYRLCWKELRTYDYDDETGIVVDIEDVKAMDEHCLHIERLLKLINETPDDPKCNCVEVMRRCPHHRDR